MEVIKCDAFFFCYYFIILLHFTLSSLGLFRILINIKYDVSRHTFEVLNHHGVYVTVKPHNPLESMNNKKQQVVF